MKDRDFMRYSRQILLEDIAIEGQQKLLASRVLIVGLGGLGAPAALYLAGAGVGTLVLADDDEVHLSNLQRQILFTTEDVNQPKAQVTRQRLNQLNPDIELVALQTRLSGEATRSCPCRRGAGLHGQHGDASGHQRGLCCTEHAADHRQRGRFRRADNGAYAAVGTGLLPLPVA